MVNERLIRLSLLLVGLLSIGGFGLDVKDFFVNKESLLRPIDVSRLENTFGRIDSSQLGGHLLPFDQYRVVQELNITGYVAPEPIVDAVEEVKVEQVYSADDFVVPFVQAPTGAWIQGRGEVAVGDEFSGDFYVIGETFELNNKPGILFELVDITDGVIALKHKESGDIFEVRIAVFEVESNLILENSESSPGVKLASTSMKTRLIEDNKYQVGTADYQQIREMSQEQVLQAVSVRTERDPFTNEVKGLRVRDVDDASPFFRMGIKKDDIVLSVNGILARDRQELFDSLKGMKESTLKIEIERMGGVRSLFFELPKVQ